MNLDNKLFDADKPVVDVFLELLRTSIWGGKAHVPNDFKDWGKVFALAKTQSVLALVAHAVLSDSGISRQLPDAAKAKLKSHEMANMAAHRLLNSSVVQVVSALDGAGVPSVLLKGQALARNYPIPELRACGDVDIYTWPENYLRACVDLDLTRIFEFFLNLGNNISCEQYHLVVCDDVGLDHNADLTACLNGEGTLNTVERVGDFLKLFKTLDVVLYVLSSCTGTCCGDSVCRLNDAGDDGVSLNVAVVGVDSVDNLFALFILAGDVHTDGDMAAFNLMVNALAKVVEEITGYAIPKLLEDNK